MNHLRSFLTTGLLLAAFAACEPFYPTIGVDDSAEKALDQLEVPDGFQFLSQRSALLRVSARDVTQSLVPNAAFVVAFLREGAAEPDTLMTAQTTETGWFETTIQWPSSVKKLLIKPFSAAFQPVEFDLSQNTGTIEIALRNQFASADDRGGGTDYALEFDGVDDVVQFDSLFPMHQAGDCSFMVWVKKNDDSNTPRSIAWSRTNMDNEKNRFNIGIADKWTVDYREPNGITHTLTNGGSALSSNVCTHIAIVRSGSSYTFYQDGAVVFQRTDNVPNLPTSLGWLLGGRGNNRFKGTMNDLQIWRKALTDSEVQAYMNQPPLGAEADLYGYWSFDEGSGDYALDASPNQRDGKLGNLAPEQKPTYVVNNCSGSGDTSSGTPDSDHDGVPDDVDACPLDPACAFKNYYPAQGALASMIFEDGFPYRGDYDLNDMVIDYNFEEDLNAAQEVVSMKIKVILRAMGASYRNGFAIELPVSPSAIASVSGFSQTDDYITLSANGTEAGQGKAVALAFDNGFDLLRTSDGGYVNTDPERDYLEPYVLTLHVTFVQPVPRATLGAAPYNPFLIINRERGRELHLPGKLPTTLADQSFFGSADDDTNFAEGKTYLTTNNLPWALNVPNSFPYLKEKQPINQGFLKFNEWAESGGAVFSDWFEDKPGYRNTEKIF